MLEHHDVVEPNGFNSDDKLIFRGMKKESVDMYV